MVLKKSNSTLNSGATQRALDHCYWLRDGNTGQTYTQYNQINFYLTGAPACFSEPQDKAVSSIFNFIADVLGCEEVKELIKETCQPPRAYYSYYNPHLRTLNLSLDKKKRWQLVDSIEEMTSLTKSNDDILQFTDNIPLPVLIGFEKLMSDRRVQMRWRNGSVVKRVYPIWPIRVLKSDLPIVPETGNSDEAPEHCMQQKDTRKAPRWRGTQRINGLLDKNESIHHRRRQRKKRKRKLTTHNLHGDDEKGNNTSSAYTLCTQKESRMPKLLGYEDFRLQIDIVGELEKDSRASTVKTPIKKWTIRRYNSPRVSLCKGKGSTKGNKYGRRTFTHSDLMEEIERGYDDVVTWQHTGRCDDGQYCHVKFDSPLFTNDQVPVPGVSKSDGGFYNNTFCHSQVRWESNEYYKKFPRLFTFGEFCANDMTADYTSPETRCELTNETVDGYIYINSPEPSITVNTYFEHFNDYSHDDWFVV